MSTLPPVPGAPPFLDTQPYGNFLGQYLEEDMGLKETLTGLLVTDLQAGSETPRPVPVWFLNPEREERRITYPSITINFTGERVAHEREHRGNVPIYYRYLQEIPFDSPRYMQYPIPMDLDYQVVVHTRINQHFSQINGALMMGPLHPRFGYVICPAGTIRRLEILAMTTANGQESDKRIFRHIYQVRIPTEVEDPQSVAGTRVEKIVLRIYDTVSGQEVYGPPPRAITATSGPTLPPDPTLTPGGQYQSQTAGE